MDDDRIVFYIDSSDITHIVENHFSHTNIPQTSMCGQYSNIYEEDTYKAGNRFCKGCKDTYDSYNSRATKHHAVIDQNNKLISELETECLELENKLSTLYTKIYNLTKGKHEALDNIPYSRFQ